MAVHCLPLPVACGDTLTPMLIFRTNSCFLCVPMLEPLEQFLVERLGPEWWVDTELENLHRKSKPASRREPK